MTEKELITIGRNVPVDFVGHVNGVPAKVDTGADSSAVWASDVVVDKENVLSFRLFDAQSPYFTGETIRTKQYKVAMIRTASGHQQLRFRVSLALNLGGRKIRALVNLADRSQQEFPVLIGRRTLSGKFLVDVSLSHYPNREKATTIGLNKQLIDDPYKFYVDQYKKQKGQS